MSARNTFTKDISPLIDGTDGQEKINLLVAVIVGMLIGQESTTEQIKQITKQVKKLNKSK